MSTTLTSKGQVTVPKAIRDQLKLQPGDRVEFVLQDDGTVRMIPIKSSVTKLKGFLPKPDRPLSLAEMDAAIAKGALHNLDRD
jgi:antitoxin PrlF